MKTAAPLLCAVALAAACRSTYYSAWEKLGKEKRDLLVDRVKETRAGQKEAAEEFKDALTRLQEAYGKQGTALEKAYDRLKDRYDSAQRHAEDLRRRARDMNRVASDLFAEWEQEIEAYADPELKQKSRRNLERTRERFGAMSATVDRAEARMEPVLTKLKDHVTFLKHSLNAQAIAGLEGERREIERGIAALIAQMDESIREADAFLRSMEGEDG